MAATERLYKIDMLIRQHGVVGFGVLQAALEVSRATLQRDLEYLRSRLGAPIVHDRVAGGYRFEADGPVAAPGMLTAASGRPERTVAGRHELPGLWFNERELYSLLMSHQLLSGLDADGVLSRHLQPLLERIHTLLARGADAQAGARTDPAQVLMQRVKIMAAARRPVPVVFFERVGEALVHRRRLRLRYLSRGRREVGERDVSPQRLVHHRNTWYLDAWCHRADAMRRFALDAMEAATLLDSAALDLSAAQISAAMDTGYGIYAGGRRRWATLVFNAVAAQWASREKWHPAQRGCWRADGSWELKLPYVDATELAMDVLRQGEQVSVEAPAGLRELVRAKLAASLALYPPPG